MIRRLILAFVAVALVATVCSPPGDDAGQGPRDDIELQLELAANLEPFEDCEDLAGYLREATLEAGPHASGVGVGPTWRVLEGTTEDGVGVAPVAGGAAPMTASPDAGGVTGPVSGEAPVDVPGDPAVPVPEAPDAPDVPVADAPASDTGGPGDVALVLRPQGEPGGEEPPEFSGTNVQETGVDEPDVVKTDGRRIVSLVHGEVHVSDAADGGIEHLGSVELPDHGDELFLHGDRVIVLSRSWDDGESRGAAPPPSEDARTVYVGSGGTPDTVVTAIDISDPAEPTVEQTRRFAGDYVSARLHAGVIRLVLRSGPGIESISFSGPSTEELEELNRREREAAGTAFAGTSREAIERERRRIFEDAFDEAVEDLPDEEWLPALVRQGEGGHDAPVPCDGVRHPPEPSGTGMVTVLTLEAAGSMDPVDTAAVVAEAQTVYASTRTLYVGTTEQTPTDRAGDPPTVATTALHAFDISDPARTEYVASGRVRGQLLNQWSLSEHEGHLRVATTDGHRGAPDSESFLTVLRPQGDCLQRVGQVGGLGPGERIYAARFFGDIGFVVTFRETDPLYALDLSDPEDPKVAGELKIPGFSNYLHPVGDGLLLGVGQDADEDGRTQGTQLSLFDVSDLSDPERIDVEVIRNGHSDVEHDHRAFLWWAPEHLAVVPLEVWDHPRVRPAGPDTGDTPAEPFVGAAGFLVENGGIHPAGRITHGDMIETPEERALGGSGDTDPTGGPAISDDDDDVEVVELVDPHPPVAPIIRSLAIGDTLYTFSHAGILASTLDGFDDRGWAAY